MTSIAVCNDNLIINLKTGYDVDKVYIIYGDPYDAGIGWEGTKWSQKEMPLSSEVAQAAAAKSDIAVDLPVDIPVEFL